MVGATAFEAAGPGLGFITLTLTEVVPLGMVTLACRSVAETYVVLTAEPPTSISAPPMKLVPVTSSV